MNEKLTEKQRNNIEIKSIFGFEEPKQGFEKVFVLEANGSKCVFPNLQDLFEEIRIEFEENYHNKTEFKISSAEMSKEELENMPEFDGF